jgi:hypothetical protein
MRNMGIVVRLGVCWILSSATVAPVAAARADTKYGTPAHLEQQRFLLDNYMHFSPLSCNQDLALQPCVSWTAKFGVQSVHTQRIVIPCGECIVMDFAGTLLHLQDGIDIAGKLLIQPTTETLKVRTTLVAVQGELEIRADSRAVNGSPLVEFVLYNNGSKDQYFTAIDENASLCTLVEGCVAGVKSIVVAGGKLSIHGVPSDTPSWLPLYDVIADNGALSMIVLDSSVKGKWDAGAEILITSHTMHWNEHQVRVVVSVIDHPTDATKAILELDLPIVRPTTVLDDERFAVEVALLSKNIVWRGETDVPGDWESDLIGGHFWIMHTPSVQQVIEGIELVNFGQQGSLGRYPIHFHLCGDVSSSIVSKNTIRQSNQRCVVVHGTDNLVVQENVAYDTKGHCFILEDGIETGNQFVRNLGAQTGAPLKIIPDEGKNGHETDQDRPTTFWITNTMNSWVGNVAAGAEGIAFWFELLVRGPLQDTYEGGKPKNNPMTLFKDNVAHSGGVSAKIHFVHML